MRKTLLGAAIGLLAGGGVGALFAAASLLVDPTISADGSWLFGLNAAIGAYAGLLIGGLSASTHVAGGSYWRAVAFVGLGLGGAVLLAQFAFGSTRPIVLLLCATAGALAGARAGRRRNPAGGDRPPRRWFQFNLGMLLALVFMVSAGLATYVSGPLEQNRIAARVVAGGGHVRYEAKVPGWVIESLGDASRHWFDSLTEVQVHDARDADIPRLKRLPHLQRLGVGGAEMTDQGLRQLAPWEQLTSLELFNLPAVGDAGFEHLPDLTNVEELWLSKLSISDAGFKQINRMPRLRKLWLYQLPISDSGLSAIAELTELEFLSLHNLPNLTDDGLKSISRLTRLNELEITNCNLSDAALVHLKSLDRLERLKLRGVRQITGAGFRELEPLGALRFLETRNTALTDDGLETIARLTRLKWLQIDGTQITDDGFAHVARLKDLEFLSFTDTAVTNAGLKHLKALPRLHDYFYSGSQVTDDAVERLRAEMQLQEQAR